MAWLLLILSIVLEVCGTTCMKLSQGFTRPLPSVLMFLFYAACFTIFTFAVRNIDISTAYAIWCGLGVALIAVIGITWFDERLNLWKIAGWVLVVLGVAALQLGNRTSS